MLYHTDIFQCNNINKKTQNTNQKKTNLKRKASCPSNWQLNWQFSFWKAVFLAGLYHLECTWRRNKKENHGVVAWLGFETALSWWCNDQSSAQWFYDTTGVSEVRFRLWFWSPAVLVFFLPTQKENECYSYFLLPNPPTSRLLSFLPELTCRTDDFSASSFFVAVMYYSSPQVCEISLAHFCFLLGVTSQTLLIWFEKLELPVTIW